MHSARQISADALSSFDTNDNKLPILVERLCNKYGLSLSEQQRSRVIINEVIRSRGILDYIIEKCSSKKINQIQPKLRSILRIGCYELIFDDIVYMIPTGAYALLMYITGFIFICILRKSN